MRPSSSDEANFASVWSYRISSETAQEFIQLYGSDGAWVGLFRRAEGYLGTCLYRDSSDKDRYLTIDRWESEGAYRSFRREGGEEFEYLDRGGEELTLEEVSLGEFLLIDAGD